MAITTSTGDPVDVVLARAVERIPLPGTLPGGCVYEMKWDGFRALIRRDDDGASVWSRQGKDLTRHFPDIAAATVAQLTPGTVLDGELVAWKDNHLDFGALQQRLTTSARAITHLTRRQPASYVGFDVLTIAGQDVRSRPFTERRDLLEQLATGWVPPFNLSPTTIDVDVARRWFDDMAVAGIEGLVIKGAAQPYRGGRRDWLKVKRRDTLDVICAAVIGPLEQPRAIVAGLPIDGELRIVGRSTVLRATVARALGRHLRPPTGTHPWPLQVPPSAVDRFARDREPVDLTLVEPLVVEVSSDVAWSGRSFRHALRFVRTRPEIEPGDVELS